MLTRSHFRTDAFNDCSTVGHDPYNHVGIKCGINWNWLLARMIHGPKFRLHLWMPPKETISYLDED